MTRKKRNFPWHEKDFKSRNLIDVSMCVAPVAFVLLEVAALFLFVALGCYIWIDTWGTVDALWGYLGALACFAISGLFFYHLYRVIFKGKELKYSVIEHADDAFILIVFVILATIILALPVWLYNLFVYKNVK